MKKITLKLATLIIATFPLAHTFADDFTPETEETSVQTIIIDADNTGGDLTLQFGKLLNEQIKWDSTNTRFNISTHLRIDGQMSQIGNTLTLDADDTGGDSIIKFWETTGVQFGWDDSFNTLSTFDTQLLTRIYASSNAPFACTASVSSTLWTDTDTGIVYSCDPSRNKWLSISEENFFGDESGSCSAGKDPNNSASCNVDWGNGLGPDGSTLLGLYIPHDITITGYGFSADNDACTSGSFDVEVWGTGANNNDNDYTLDAEIATGLTGQAHNANNLNIDIAGNQYILWGIDNNCGQAIDDWNTILYFKYR